jgi:hypothetical protein
MKPFRIIIASVSFLGLAGGDVFGMSVKPELMEGICRTGQFFRLEMRSAKESDRAPLDKGLSLCNSLWRLLVDYTLSYGKVRLSVCQLLPPGKEIKDLSDCQKDALVMFGSQLNEKGELTITSPYLLAGAINTLDGDKDPASEFILKQIISRTPRDFLKDSDFSD